MYVCIMYIYIPSSVLYLAIDCMVRLAYLGTHECLPGTYSVWGSPHQYLGAAVDIAAAIFAQAAQLAK